MSGRRRLGDATDRVRIDPTACEGIGMCAHVAPGVIGVDSWGYPVLPPTEVGGRDLRAARSAISACPRRALFLASEYAG
ncbi:MAG: ferredoxin [Kineosporiaceae bacterium]|jgi:ferredoxin|nr:ferredoxin [Kineosporiaceae bacterium]MBK8074007.1 ferredoxin [Kineosporiaceae bacterium]